MNASRFEFDSAPKEAQRTTPQRSEVAVRAEMRASPADAKQDTGSEDQPEEPGYGHGV